MAGIMTAWDKKSTRKSTFSMRLKVRHFKHGLRNVQDVVACDHPSCLDRCVSGRRNPRLFRDLLQFAYMHEQS
jgi:hypothetical protein